MRYKSFRKAGACVLASALAVTMVVPNLALAAENNKGDEFWSSRNPTAAVTPDSNLLKTYGVRAGSAGPDFLGITNTNYDYKGSPSNGQYDYTSINYNGTTDGARLALWATSVNESVNPYYANLLYTALTGNDSTHATTWTKNDNSWGDSSNQASTVGNGSTNTSTINGLEYQPDIIFGANKTTNWSNFNYSSTNIAQAVANGSSGYTNYNPTYVNNDSTNLWTQVYTINRLAKAADNLKTGTSKTTRYDNNSSLTGALAYEKALRGNLLYIASQIDQGAVVNGKKVEKKTVAYLYAIDDNGTGYFFIPEASGLTNGNDTGKTETASKQDGADANYAANNGTIDLDYMDTLPFITNTFKNGTTVQGGIVMKVEDIWKANPAVSVGSSQTNALSDVDAIIYNTNTQLTGTWSAGDGNGRNANGIANAATLTTSSVQAWAAAHGFTGSQIIAGDDWGTSNRQGFGSAETTEAGMSPMLYCQRNYTTDKPARAAWAYSQLYPELYPNADASYAYWVKNVYHINMADVPAVVKYFTNQSDTVSYTAATQSTLEADYQTGLDWWVNTGSKKSDWNQYAYYNGSSRGSYYDSNTASEEPVNTIGIFAPTDSWAAQATKATAKKANTVKASTKKVTVKKGKTKSVKITKAKGKITAKTSKKSVATVSPKSSSKKSVTLKIKGKKKGKATITVKAAGNANYKAKSIKIKVTVK